MIQQDAKMISESACTRPLLLLVGDAARAAWQAAGLDELAITAVPVEDIERVIEWIEHERREPAVVVIGQAWPGEIGDSELMRLRQAAPLARIVGLFGSWCEGETRSGKPWPGAWRVFEHQWPQRGARLVAELSTQSASVWNLPPTASAEEQLFCDIDALVKRLAGGVEVSRASATVAVVAEAHATASSLADACRGLGYQATALRRLPAKFEQEVSAILWDIPRSETARIEIARQLVELAGGAPIVAVAGFPRPELIAWAEQAGVAAVLSKPFLLADLDWQIARLVGAARRQSNATNVSSTVPSSTELSSDDTSDGMSS